MPALSSLIYLACALSSLLCFGLLARGYMRSRREMLFWSAACFAGLTVNNLLLLIDLAALPSVDLQLDRTLTMTAALAVLLYGFIWTNE